ncbi:immunoglobulin superfamily member 1 [Sardina pilchardus]|uniref:immunoglobulin superfamily member 1 n=1 Tax=Sardina pilchardus TaxID=27697 RepID=UPI002E15A13F
MEPNLLPVFYGEKVSLQCVIQGEPTNGPWWYRWYRDGSLLQDTGKEVILIQRDYHSRYKCTASQRPGNELESEPMKIPVMGIPKPTIIIQSPQQPFYRGDSITLRCDLTQGEGWEYHWKRNAIPTATLTVDPQSPVFPGENVTLKCEIDSPEGWMYTWHRDISELVNKTVERNITITVNDAKSVEGQYWCQGERKDRPTASQGSNTVTIHAKALPKPKLAIEPQSPVFTGENVTLKCEIKNQPGWNYRWYKGNRSHLIPTLTSNTTTIKVVAKSDEGPYWCQGQRTDRDTLSQLSDEIHIRVKALPTPKLTIDAPSPVFPGENVTLKCEVKSSNGWKYKWFKKNNLDPVATSDTNTTFIRVVETDAGIYWCQGERRDRPISSKPSKEAHLHIMPLPEAKLTAEPHSPVSTGGTVTLKCVIESHSNWTYKWYKDTENNLVIEESNFTITRATDSDEGTYWCQGVRRERPTSTQLSNSVLVGKRGE